MIPVLDYRLLVGFLGLSALVTAGMAAYTCRRRDTPGALWLAATLAATTIWTGTYAAGLLTHDPASRPFWEHLQWFGTAALPVCFFLFVLEYTGQDRLTTRRSVVGLFAIPAFTVVLVWTNEWHNLIWVENRVVVQDGLATMVATHGPWFWLVLVYSYALVLVGGALLIRLLFVSEYLYAEQSLLFSLGIVVPLLGNVVAVFVPTSPPGFDLTPYGFAIWGITLFVIVYRGQLFSLIPATRQLGQNAAIAQLDDGVVILDTEGSVIYLNDAAESIFDCEVGVMVGRPVQALVDTQTLALDQKEDVTELEREGRHYEIRQSPISDRRGRTLGHTLIVHDVTTRHRREQQLAAQRQELERVNELNAAIRRVNRALVSAVDREGIHRSVCESLAAATLYETVCMTDTPTATGVADNWTTAGAECPPPDLSTFHSVLEHDEGNPIVVEHRTDGAWTVLPIAYRQTMYGVLCVRSTAESLAKRERDALVELGELVGYTINAIENRQLLAADTVIEVTLESDDEGAVLATVAAQTDSTLTLKGLIPATENGSIAFIGVEHGASDDVRDAFERVSEGAIRVVRSGDLDTDEDVLVWHLPEDSLLGTLAAAGVNVINTVADGETGVYGAELASDHEVRTLLQQLNSKFPRTRMEAKQRKDRPIELLELENDDVLDDLTDRQREVLESAFRAGYFDWPRESTAEDLAESLDITPPTLHGHLRKAEQSVFDALFTQ